MQGTRVQSLGQEEFLEKEMAPHSGIVAWRIPWTKEPGRLQSTGSQRVRRDWVCVSYMRWDFPKSPQPGTVLAISGRTGWWNKSILMMWNKWYTAELYLKRVTNKDLLYSTRNSAQWCVAAWMGGEFGENGSMYMDESFAGYRKQPQHC